MASHGDDELAIKVSSVFKQYGRGRQAQRVLKGINMDVPYYNMLVSVQYMEQYSSNLY